MIEEIQLETLESLFNKSEQTSVLKNQLKTTEEARDAAQKELAAWRGWAIKLIRKCSVGSDKELRQELEKILIKSV